MIDEKVFSELLNRGVITRVGLKASDFNSVEELKKIGYATKIESNAIYDNIVTEFEEKANLLADFLSNIKKGGNVVLPMNITIDEPIVIETDVNLDLNNHKILVSSWIEDDGSTNSYAFWVKNGTLTINGNGEVVTSDAEYSMAIWVNGGNAVINGGKFVNAGDGCDLIYLSNKGNLVINNGYFVPTEDIEENSGTADLYTAINIKDSSRDNCSAVVKGGKFFMFNPANNKSEGNDTNFVSDGYEVFKDGFSYIVRKVDK